jgi:hypothetical protein
MSRTEVDMSIDTMFGDLYAQHLRPAYEQLHQLRTIVDDNPSRDHVLVHLLADRLDETMGWLVDAEDAALAGQQAIQAPLDLDRARQALLLVEVNAQRCLQTFFCRLVDFETGAGLARVSRERGAEWRKWAGSVRGALEDSRGPLLELNQALFRSCFELAGRTTAASVKRTVHEQ